jgi:hypothetical protein
MGGDSSNGNLARDDLAPGLGSNKWEAGYRNDGTVDDIIIVIVIVIIVISLSI